MATRTDAGGLTLSYILFSTGGGGLTSPVGIVDGGTGETTAASALEALSTIAFANSGANVNWGSTTIDPPVLPADLDNVADVVDQLIQGLNALGILG